MKHKMLKAAMAAAIAGLMAAGGYYYWQAYIRSDLPEAIAVANGRLEANQIDIATKLAGRIIEVVPREGDTVAAGQVVARLDAAEYKAQLDMSVADAERARQALAVAESTMQVRRSEMTLAKQEFERTSTLARKGIAAKERLDQRQQQLTSATAALTTSEAQAAEAKAAIVSAEAMIVHMQSFLDETEIRAPVRGRVQYRLAEPGAVLGAGSRILTLLDLSDVTMTVFLPAGDAGRLKIGGEARVVLDVAPDSVFPMRISFVDPEAQFTPKTVETASEREKLMFRVKLQAAPELVKRAEDRVLSGLRGVAYVRTSEDSVWPDRLAVKLPETLKE
jgi:HlyD family secretion protein